MILFTGTKHLHCLVVAVAVHSLPCQFPAGCCIRNSYYISSVWWRKSW